MTSGKFEIRSEIGRAPVRRLSSKGATWSLRIIGLVHSPFKAVMVGSNPPGITIELKTWSVHVTPVISVMVSTQLLYITE